MLKKKYAKGKGAYEVTFTLPVEAAPDAKEVKVVGEFNDWNTATGAVMKKGKSDFKATIDLEGGRDYQFKYIVDDSRWENDWKADRYQGENSVVELPEAPKAEKKAKKSSKKSTSKNAEPAKAKQKAAKTEDKPKRKPGRPKKEATATNEAKPKRKPGRPKKNAAATSEDKPKRKPGRPRKNAAATSEDKPKRGPGRPRKYPKDDTPKVKRGPGRPRKNPEDKAAPKLDHDPELLDAAVLHVPPPGTVIRRPGRPRIHPPRDPNAPRRKPGRPRKTEEEIARHDPNLIDAATLHVSPEKPKAPKKQKASTGRKPGRPRKKPQPQDGDDFKMLDGVGAKIESLLKEQGIKTFKQLVRASKKKLKAVRDNAGPRFKNADPQNWVDQAEVAAAGDWDKLASMKKPSKAGRPRKAK